MGIEYFKLPIFDRRPYCDPAEWAQRYRYMKTTASMFSFEQSPYFELPNQVMGDLAGTACVVLKVPSQTGKDLAWYTELPTPSGWVRMRDLRVGDELYSIDGMRTRVTFKTGAQYNPMFRVHFDDGTHLDAGIEHRWLVSDGRVLTTREIVVSLRAHRDIALPIARSVVDECVHNSAFARGERSDGLDQAFRHVTKCEPIPTVESYCIQVDHPSHTFLAGRQYCVTHNTETLINMLGWIVEYDRANTLLIMDTKTSGIALSKNRIRPFLRDVCGLDYSKTASSKGKDNDHSMNAVDLGIGRGANVKIGSSRCAGDLCSTPVKYLLMDELDRWQQEIRGEGDPISLAFQRQLRFRGMTVMCSTPTLEDGRINKYFKQGTCETWCAVCKCGAFMPCRWSDIDWSDPREPTIACKECGQVYTETDIKGLDHEYSPPANTEPFKDNFGRIWRSFEVFGTLCHSFYSWKSLRDYEIQALKTGEASYQSFVNTRLAEVYKPRDELSVELPALMRECRDDYSPYDLPVEVDFLCAGIDTHDNCLFVEVVGFSKDGREHWGVEYFVAPYDLQSQGGIRDCLEMLATKAYARVDGVELKIALSFIDSGGHRTNEVYTMAARSSRMMAIKGVASSQDKQDPLIRKLSKVSLNGNVKGKTHLLVLGVNAGKDALFDMEVRTITGDRCLHYWAGGGYDKTYFAGLLSEKKVGGKWIAPQRGSTPNEPLDCRVYAMAAAEYYLTKIIPRGLDPDYRRRNMAKKVSKKAEKEQEQIVIEEQKPYNGEEREVEAPSTPKPVDNSASKYEQF